jgi:hypothetical protein
MTTEAAEAAAPSYSKQAFCLFAAFGGVGGALGWTVNNSLLSTFDPAAHERDGPEDFEYQPPKNLDLSDPEQQKYLFPPGMRAPKDGRTPALEKLAATFASIGGVAQEELPLAQMEAVADLYQKREDVVYNGLKEQLLCGYKIHSRDAYLDYEKKMFAELRALQAKINAGEAELNARADVFRARRQAAVQATFDSYISGKSEAEVRQVASQLYNRLIFTLENQTTPQQAREEEISLLIHNELVLPELARRGHEVVSSGAHH